MKGEFLGNGFGFALFHKAIPPLPVRREDEIPDRQANEGFQGQAQKLSEAPVRKENRSADVQRSRPFLDVFQEDAVGLLGAFQGKDLVALRTRNDQGVYFAAPDGPQGLFGFLQPGLKLFNFFRPRFRLPSFSFFFFFFGPYARHCDLFDWQH